MGEQSIAYTNYHSPKISLASKTTPVVSSSVQAVDVLELEEANSVVFRETFTDESVTKAMLELKAKSAKLSSSAIIYLVLDTPGGSVDAGTRLISFAKALPQKIKTVTLFAASMGFITVQGLDERLVLDTGTLMSHRAKLGGMGGELPGELITRLKFIMGTLEKLDAMSADRMSLTLKAYQELIRDEYWVSGQDAVNDKAADRTVLVKCGKSLDGTQILDVETMFGNFKVTLSKCPMIPGVLAVEGGKEAMTYVKSMFGTKQTFVNQYVTTNEWMKFQR
jgi:ATP-dependent protease ClpP protease subunit